MIITCNKCSTSFNLDDFLVKADGSKVRCSVCKHIFTAYPLPQESEHGSSESSDIHLESDPDTLDTLETPSEFEMDDNELSLTEFDLDIESTDIENTAIDMDDIDFDSDVSDLEMDTPISLEATEFEMDEEDYDSQEGLELEESPLEFEDNDIEFQDDLAEDPGGLEFEPIEDESLSLDEEDMESSLKLEDTTDDSIFDEDDFELEFDVEDEDDVESADILDDKKEKKPLEIEPDPAEEISVLSLEKRTTEEDIEEESPVITLEDDFSEYDVVLEQETEPEDDSLEEETLGIKNTLKEEKTRIETPDAFLDTPEESIKTKKRSRVGIPVIILLVIFVLVMGAYITSLVTGYHLPYISDIKLPYIEQYLKKQPPETMIAKPVPNQKSVTGRFVTNSTSGTLFVITGRVENPSTIDLSHIEIRGALITTDKKEAKIKNAFCGNIITEEMLTTGNIADINMLLAVKNGTNNSNLNIKPGASVPFMVVFSDLPEKLQNFTVKVTGFQELKGSL